MVRNLNSSLNLMITWRARNNIIRFFFFLIKTIEQLYFTALQYSVEIGWNNYIIDEYMIDSFKFILKWAWISNNMP